MCTACKVSTWKYSKFDCLCSFEVSGFLFFFSLIVSLMELIINVLTQLSSLLLVLPLSWSLIDICSCRSCPTSALTCYRQSSPRGILRASCRSQRNLPKLFLLSQSAFHRHECCLLTTSPRKKLQFWPFRFALRWLCPFRGLVLCLGATLLRSCLRRKRWQSQSHGVGLLGSVLRRLRQMWFFGRGWARCCTKDLLCSIEWGLCKRRCRVLVLLEFHILLKGRFDKRHRKDTMIVYN